MKRLLLPILLFLTIPSFSQIPYTLKAGAGIQNLFGSSEFEFYIRLAEVAVELDVTDDIGIEADFNINLGVSSGTPNTYLFGVEGKYYLQDNAYGGLRFAAGPAAGPAQGSSRAIEIGATGGYVIPDILKGLEIYGFVGYSNLGFKVDFGPFGGNQTFSTGFFNLSVGANVHIFGNK